MPAESLFTILPPVWLVPLVALLGACVGSFLNVVAWRLPRQESLLWPASHCPRCGTSLRWYDNLPIIGWLLLQGRCRHCRQPISRRYPLVELLSAGLWLAMLQARPEVMGAAAQALPLQIGRAHV